MLPTLSIDFTKQEPIPDEGIAAAVAYLRSGALHRYGETGDKPSAVSSLEVEFAAALGRKYCVALNSCGTTLFIALRSAGVKPGDVVMTNCFTLAPVPGAVAHVGAKPVLIDVREDYTIDLADLELKARTSGAKVLLLSHMRGHICDMEALMAICANHKVAVIEDCAHTMGAGWSGKLTGTWGITGCFSLQSYKHANSGEGGLLVTDDEDVAAQAILLSGSYMLYKSHLARPADEVFERWKYKTPNFSMRMSNLAAAIVRPQLGVALLDRCRRWNERYHWIAHALEAIPGIFVPKRDAREQFVASSFQFSLIDFSPAQCQRFLAVAADHGLHIKWFGADQPVGFTSVWTHWQFFGEPQALPNADRVLGGLCDFRLPLALTKQDCEAIAQVVRYAAGEASSSFERPKSL